MAITEEEARQLIAAILDTIPALTELPEPRALVEFVSQWRAEVEAGRPVDRKLQVRESPGLDEVAGGPRSRTTTTGEFVGKKEYGQVEQLDLLIEALGLAFVAPQMMATRFLNTVEQFRETSDREKAQPISIALAPTGEAGDPLLRLDRPLVDQAVLATLPLAKLLEELSQEGGLRRRPLTPRQEAT